MRTLMVSIVSICLGLAPIHWVSAQSKSARIPVTSAQFHQFFLKMMKTKGPLRSADNFPSQNTFERVKSEFARGLVKLTSEGGKLKVTSFSGESASIEFQRFTYAKVKMLVNGKEFLLQTQSSFQSNVNRLQKLLNNQLSFFLIPKAHAITPVHLFAFVAAAGFFSWSVMFALPKCLKNSSGLSGNAKFISPSLVKNGSRFAKCMIKKLGDDFQAAIDAIQEFVDKKVKLENGNIVLGSAETIDEVELELHKQYAEIHHTGEPQPPGQSSPANNRSI